jgi:hypothetical protein
MSRFIRDLFNIKSIQQNAVLTECNFITISFNRLPIQDNPLSTYSIFHNSTYSIWLKRFCKGGKLQIYFISADIKPEPGWSGKLMNQHFMMKRRYVEQRIVIEWIKFLFNWITIKRRIWNDVWRISYTVFQEIWPLWYVPNQFLFAFHHIFSVSIQKYNP